MASIGKLTASAVSGAQEIALALAHLNFDFSLVKIEAPPEFHALGASLSKSRRQVAEHGRTHVTARKLGALFDQALPRTPKLVEIYGKRTSELAGSKIVNPQATAKDGLFSDFTGADGTSIWAAATSGSGAISVHLLACMLARIWTAAEATSIWAEIVEARKKELLQAVDHEPVSLPALLAAQVVLEREQLAEWDNSARSWLRRADEGKKQEQTQLMLILNNLNIPVNSKLDTYTSVLFALKTALLAMEELLEGRPQGVQDGSLLLALSCWHIYPDLIVLGNRTVKQNDKLVPPNAKLTIGLESSPSLRTAGVRWSLSLAHMRYYGPAISSERSLGATSARITVDQLMLVALGSVIENWDYKALDTLQVSSIILSITRCLLAQSERKSIHPVSKKTTVKGQQIGLRGLDNEWKTGYHSGPNWVRVFSDATSRLHKAKAAEQEVLLRLVALGRGSGASFISQKGTYPPPVFGISDFEAFVAMLETDEDRIAILRKYAVRFFPDALPGKVIIRYRPDLPRKEDLSFEDAAPQGIEEHHIAAVRGRSSLDLPHSSSPDNHNLGNVGSIEHDIDNPLGDSTTIKNARKKPQKRRRKATFGSKKRRRGAVKPSSPNIMDDKNMPEDSETSIPTFSLKIEEEIPTPLIALKTIPYEYTTALPSPGCASPSQPDRPITHYRWFDHRNVPLPVPKQSIFDPVEMREAVFAKSPLMVEMDPPCKYQPETNTVSTNDESTSVEEFTNLNILTLKDSRTFEVLENDVRGDNPSANEPESSKYIFFLGDPEIAAIYIAEDLHIDHEAQANMPYWASKKKQRKKRVDIEDIHIALDSGAISAQALDATLRHEDRFQYTTSLLALAAIHEAYQKLHSATIDPNIILQPLNTSACLDGFSGSYIGAGYQTQSLPRERAFACITLLETGSLDLPVSHFQNVMAVASADSLYVASQLVLDPAETTSPHTVRRIVGNVGRPGVSFLVPPAESQTLKAQPENWCLINRARYDGIKKDSFSDTSLHLSFTGWSTTVDTGRRSQGNRDVEASLIESVVSVHDRGRWIADIDILTALKKGHNQFDHEFYFRRCTHGTINEDTDHSVPLIPTSSSPTSTAPNVSIQSPASTLSAGIELAKNTPLTSVDSWEEFLDRPSGPCVVRAHKNRLARLATAVVGIRRGDRVMAGSRVCWECCTELHDLGGEEITDRITFIV